MWKTKLKRLQIERHGKLIYDSYMHKSKRTLYRLIFALAMATKVTPKQMAKFFDIEKTNKYARDFNKVLSDRTK